jgi:hypothetical protein
LHPADSIPRVLTELRVRFWWQATLYHSLPLCLHHSWSWVQFWQCSSIETLILASTLEHLLNFGDGSGADFSGGSGADFNDSLLLMSIESSILVMLSFESLMRVMLSITLYCSLSRVRFWR